MTKRGQIYPMTLTPLDRFDLCGLLILLSFDAKKLGNDKKVSEAREWIEKLSDTSGQAGAR